MAENGRMQMTAARDELLTYENVFNASRKTSR
jgi:hypothetical protein